MLENSPTYASIFERIDSQDRSGEAFSEKNLIPDSRILTLIVLFSEVFVELGQHIGAGRSQVVPVDRERVGGDLGSGLHAFGQFNTVDDRGDVEGRQRGLAAFRIENEVIKQLRQFFVRGTDWDGEAAL